MPGSRMLPSLVIFYWNFILIWKCQKWSLNRGTIVLATTIYQTKCPFTVLSALFLFFRMLPYDSRLFPQGSWNFQETLYFTYQSFHVKSSRPFNPSSQKWLNFGVEILRCWTTISNFTLFGRVLPEILDIENYSSKAIFFQSDAY